MPASTQAGGATAYIAQDVSNGLDFDHYHVCLAERPAGPGDETADIRCCEPIRPVTWGGR
jgi:hypothetical protein